MGEGSHLHQMGGGSSAKMCAHRVRNCLHTMATSGVKLVVVAGALLVGLVGVLVAVGVVCSLFVRAYVVYFVFYVIQVETALGELLLLSISLHLYIIAPKNIIFVIFSRIFFTVVDDIHFHNS